MSWTCLFGEVSTKAFRGFGVPLLIFMGEIFSLDEARGSGEDRSESVMKAMISAPGQ